MTITQRTKTVFEDYIPHKFRSILTPCSDSSLRLCAHNISFITGGSCICFAKGNPYRLNLQDLIDNLVPTIVASLLGVPVYLYFQSYESILMAPLFCYDPREADHQAMLLNLEQGVVSAMELLRMPVPPIYWIDTADNHIRALIDVKSKHLEELIPKERLYGLYSVDGKKYPQGSAEEGDLISIYYRNLALYRDDFLLAVRSYLSGESILKPADDNNVGPSFAVVENIGQKKAISLAGIDTNGSSGCSICFGITLNRQGKEMARGNANHKLELRSTKEQLYSRGRLLSDCSYPYVHFYGAIFSEYTPVEVMLEWKARIAK